MANSWLILFAINGFQAAHASADTQVCHNGRLLSVNHNAKAAHLRHGDHLPGTWYADVDVDGFGDPASPISGCQQPAGTVENSDDCDDTSGSVHPARPETCNGVDDDCDGTVDQGAADATTWYADLDGDGYGGPDFVVACQAPEGHLDSSDDCDDADPTAYPGAPETCDDGIDQDCDLVDEACPLACEDLDCDGLPDVVIMNYSDGDGATDSRAFLTAPTGDLSPSSFFAMPTFYGRRAVAEDLNGDDRKDLLVVGDCSDASCLASLPTIYWNSPTGFDLGDRTELPFDRVALDACVGDLDADGLPDIVIAGNRRGSSYAVNSAVLYGATGYSVEEALPTPGAFRCAIADLDGDGDDDLAFSGWFDGDWNTESRVFWNDGGFSPTDFDALPTDGARSLDIADYDNDGFLDLTVSGFRDVGDHVAVTRVYYGSAAGFSVADRDSLTLTGAHEVRSADLDQDGWLDLVVASLVDGTGTSTNSTSYVFWGSPAGFSTSDATALPMWGANDVAIADLDADGWLDLAFANERRQQTGSPTTYLVDSTIWWGGPSGFHIGDTLTLPTPGASQVRAHDLDLDGHLDLVFASYFDTDSITESSVYWGASGGAYSTANRTLLPSAGAIGITIVGP